MEPDFLSMTSGEWRSWMEQAGEKPFRGDIVFRHLHQRHAVSYDEMTDLGKALREKLSKECPLNYPRVETVQRAEDGTAKFLLRLYDGKAVECVLMKYKFGYSLCISSQAGCRMGCRFCASTLGGLERSLAAGEMAAEVYAVERSENLNISHIVIMGCGEPFDNYDALLRFLELIHDEKGRNLSKRNITVSTCGLPNRIRQFADEGTGVSLAISLHAPNDEIRKKIMRVAEGVPMEKLMDAVRYYQEKTSDRVTFEYILIDGINDSDDNARELAERLKGMLAHVNVIPVNPVEECGFARPSEARIRRFMAVLEEKGVNVTRRREMGKNIDAACGQLRARAGKKLDH
ncbi:MAG: 23S rRNA (adenine(2503)-C(2))-methyltransferase RlmN [Firmicutes bacterium]|nr:23S rRNA (adenine(2503)-C(2))-methyltransferase RlmN [Bacillota bacterium]